MRPAPGTSVSLESRDASEFEDLLNNVARARDEATRLKLGLTSYLLDVVCLDLNSMASENIPGRVPGKRGRA